MKLRLPSPLTIIIILSILGGILWTWFPAIRMYAMYTPSRSTAHMIGQFLGYSFLHGGFWHTVSNVLFFLVIGRTVEIIHHDRYIVGLWCITTISVGWALRIFTDGLTIGGSGFAMALLAVYTYDFYQRKDPQYKAGLIFIVINVLIGINSNISLVGHLSGAITGLLYAFIASKLKK